MKKVTLFFAMILIFVLLFFSQSKKEIDVEKAIKKSQVPIGTVVASMLEPQIFFEIYNRRNWVPADGRPAPADSYYSILKRKYGFPVNVVDMRGVYMRGLNNFGSDPQESQWRDPDVDRKVGSLQADSTKLPNNAFSAKENGDHTHGIQPHHAGGGNCLAVGQTHNPGTYVRAGHIGPSGTHVHEIIGGDYETRPKNVALYFYVKVNDY